MIRRLLMTCVALAGCLASCATLVPKLAAPQLTVTSVTFLGGNLQQQQIQLRLHVANPNNRTIAVRSIEANLDLAGMPFATGVSDAAFSLPARGQTDFTLDVAANVGNALVVLAASMSHRLVDYRLHGQVRLQQGLVRTLHFDQKGRVRL